MDQTENDLLAARVQARRAQSTVDAELLLLHRSVVAKLADPDRSQAIRTTAAERIDRWERDRLCHNSYILLWRQWLAMPAAELARLALSEDENGRAMRQNTPFGFMREPSAAELPPSEPA